MYSVHKEIKDYSKSEVVYFSVFLGSKARETRSEIIDPSTVFVCWLVGCFRAYMLWYFLVEYVTCCQVIVVTVHLLSST